MRRLVTQVLGRCGFAASLMLAASLGFAETYKWVDEKGVTHYGDRIPPEYSQQGNSTLNKRGVTVKQTAPALTPEQRQAQREESERLKEALKLAEEQQRQDLALVHTYATEAEIDLARDRRVAQIDQVILQARQRDELLVKRAAVVEQESKVAKAASKRAAAQGELADLARQRVAMQAAIEKLNGDKREVTSHFAIDKQRYREIKTKGITSTTLSAVARRPGGDRITELALTVSDALVTECMNRWVDTSGNQGSAYAVAARLIGRGDREEVVVEGRSRSVKARQNEVRRWTCALTADRKIDTKETEVRKALATIGAQY